MNRRITLLLLALVVAMPLVACGDGASGESSANTGADGAPSGSDFCSLAQQVVTAQTQIDAQLDGTGSPDDLEAAFANYLSLLDGLRAAAPVILQPDVATTRTGFEAFDAALSTIDYDLARVAADPALGEAMTDQLQVMRSTEVTTAMTNVDAYAVETCGFSLQSIS